VARPWFRFWLQEGFAYGLGFGGMGQRLLLGAVGGGG